MEPGGENVPVNRRDDATPRKPAPAAAAASPLGVAIAVAPSPGAATPPPARGRRRRRRRKRSALERQMTAAARPPTLAADAGGRDTNAADTNAAADNPRRAPPPPRPLPRAAAAKTTPPRVSFAPVPSVIDPRDGGGGGGGGGVSSVSSDSDHDGNDDDDDDAADDRTRRRRPAARSSAWRASNALNVDRFDFCLLINTERGQQQAAKSARRDGGADRRRPPRRCLCVLAASCCGGRRRRCRRCRRDPRTGSVHSDSDITDDDDDDDDDHDDHDDGSISTAATTAAAAATTLPSAAGDAHVDRGPVQRLQERRRRARRRARESRDDGVRPPPPPHAAAAAAPRHRRAPPTSLGLDGMGEVVRTDHSGAGLDGRRMVSLIAHKLTAAGLQVKRVRNLAGNRTILKLRAPQRRLEEEAERMRLTMRTKDGGYARFKMADRHCFCGAGYDDADADDDDDADDGDAAHGNKVLFRSSDRQSIILHIIKSNRSVGGAQLRSNTEPCGAAVVAMFPVHMLVRVMELRRTWSTALCCCRAPMQSRYGAMLPRGSTLSLPAGAAADGGAVLAAMPFRFAGEQGEAAEEAAEADADADGPGGTDADGTAATAAAAVACRRVRCCRCRQCRGARDCATCGWLVRQPLDAISEYFGETVGFYFAFLEFYTISLVFPSAAGIVLFCFQVYSRRIDHWLLPFYSLFLGVWSMVFLVRWRRRRVELAYRWGVMDHEDEEIERVEFQGEYRISPGTCVPSSWFGCPWCCLFVLGGLLFPRSLAGETSPSPPLRPSCLFCSLSGLFQSRGRASDTTAPCAGRSSVSAARCRPRSSGSVWWPR